MMLPGIDVLPAHEQQLLREHFAGDPDLLQQAVSRRLAGVPLAYLLGWVDYRGRRFMVDERVFITDPETGYMLDRVIDQLQRAEGGDQACVAELGLGCGAIGISLLKALPGLRLVGLDIDAGALAVALLNAKAHGVTLDAVQSDFFSAWGQRLEPLVVYGDLPWGDDSSVYEADRPLAHYLAMPRHSVFPSGGPMGMHRRALQAVRERGWSSQIILNCGMLPSALVLSMARTEGAARAEMVEVATNVSLLQCRMH
jgi:predicted RNA methylase